MVEFDDQKITYKSATFQRCETKITPDKLYKSKNVEGLISVLNFFGFMLPYDVNSLLVSGDAIYTSNWIVEKAQMSTYLCDFF